PWQEGLLELQRCRANFAGGCAALGSLHQRAGEMRFTGCEARKYGGGLYVKGSLVQAGGQMAVTQCHSEAGGGLAAQELSTNGTISLEECSASQGGGAGVTSLRQGPTGRLECHGCRAQRGGCLSASGVLAAEGHVEALRNDGGPAVLSSGRATFGALWVSQAQPPAVQVLGGLLAVQELTAGPSKWALELKATHGAIDVKSANCGEVDCGFHVNEKYQNATDLVRPLCRAGSGIADIPSDADGWVSRGCYKCPGGEFQLQQGVAAGCTPCPAIWKCANKKLEMPKGVGWRPSTRRRA
ncbi:unnamed protein product, partial [Effrenium voratum]